MASQVWSLLLCFLALREGSSCSQIYYLTSQPPFGFRCVYSCSYSTDAWSSQKDEDPLIAAITYHILYIWHYITQHLLILSNMWHPNTMNSIFGLLRSATDFCTMCYITYNHIKQINNVVLCTGHLDNFLIFKLMKICNSIYLQWI